MVSSNSSIQIPAKAPWAASLSWSFDDKRINNYQAGDVYRRERFLKYNTRVCLLSKRVCIYDRMNTSTIQVVCCQKRVCIYDRRRSLLTHTFPCYPALCRLKAVGPPRCLPETCCSETILQIDNLGGCDACFDKMRFLPQVPCAWRLRS